MTLDALARLSAWVSNNCEVVAQIELGNDGEEVIVRARKDARSLLLSGAPIDEPVVQHGPFVINTEQEIRQAIEYFSHGEFGELAD